MVVWLQPAIWKIGRCAYVHTVHSLALFKISAGDSLSAQLVAVQKALVYSYRCCNCSFRDTLQLKIACNIGSIAICIAWNVVPKLNLELKVHPPASHVMLFDSLIDLEQNSTQPNLPHKT